MSPANLVEFLEDEKALGQELDMDPAAERLQYQVP
jgi:hypothetical protein